VTARQKGMSSIWTPGDLVMVAPHPFREWGKGEYLLCTLRRVTATRLYFSKKRYIERQRGRVHPPCREDFGFFLVGKIEPTLSEAQRQDFLSRWVKMTYARALRGAARRHLEDYD